MKYGMNLLLWTADMHDGMLPVLEKLKEKRWLIGGENSGHILLLDKHTTGDAIIAALAVLRSLVEQRVTLAQAADGITLFPQRLINVRVPKGYDWKANDAIRAAQAGTVTALGTAGRVLLRPSGTEPVLRVMVEAQEAGVADKHAQALADVIAAATAA